MHLRNDLLLKAARGEATDRTPVWLMRQAGRILPQYRAVRDRLPGFKDLVTNPELVAEVTLQPVDLLGVDAAIIFSDILVIPDAMGLSYEMAENKGPFFPKTIQNAQDVTRLRVLDAEVDLDYVMTAIKLTRRDLADRVPLIGFAGAPWTLFCYMIQGEGSKTFSKARGLLYSDPALAHQLLDLITRNTINYINGQIKSGVHLIQLFDSWAGILSPDLYSTFSIAYLKRICNAIQEVPVTVFAKDAYFALPEFRTLDCETIGLDWIMDVDEARELYGETKTLQGNLDPCALYGSFEQIKRETEKMLDRFGPNRHIANLGHGVYPDTDPDKVRCFVETVKEYSTVQRAVI